MALSPRVKHVLHCTLLLSFIVVFELVSGAVRLWPSLAKHLEGSPIDKYVCFVCVLFVDEHRSFADMAPSVHFCCTCCASAHCSSCRSAYSTSLAFCGTMALSNALN